MRRYKESDFTVLWNNSIPRLFCIPENKYIYSSDIPLDRKFIDFKITKVTYLINLQIGFEKTYIQKYTLAHKLNKLIFKLAWENYQSKKIYHINKVEQTTIDDSKLNEYLNLNLDHEYGNNRIVNYFLPQNTDIIYNKLTISESSKLPNQNSKKSPEVMILDLNEPNGIKVVDQDKNHNHALHHVSKLGKIFKFKNDSTELKFALNEILKSILLNSMSKERETDIVFISSHITYKKYVENYFNTFESSETTTVRTYDLSDATINNTTIRTNKNTITIL